MRADTAWTKGATVRILVLGAGFGGLELTTQLSDELGDEAEIVLIDKGEGFVFGYSKLDVMFGRTVPEAVVHPYRDVVKPGVRFVQTEIRAIDPVARTVETDAGTFDGDVMVVALGADLDPAATPGLVEGGHEFYTVPGAFALRDVLADFPGGRVIVGVTSTPFKCPPAPSETALLVHDFLTERGLRDRSDVALLMPLPVPIPPSPVASEAILAAFAARDIEWHPNVIVRALDPERKVLLLADGEEMPYDLFLGVPRHHAPAVVQDSGMCVDGWIPVDPRTLETQFPGVYAVGDVTSVGTPKAGVFAEGQAAVVAAAVIARHADAEPGVEYDGTGKCYLEFGDEGVARVEVTFQPGQPPSGVFEPASAEGTALKAEFGTTRIRRWFGRDWG
jgi:sulfide:quinone oxidoreductase